VILRHEPYHDCSSSPRDMALSTSARQHFGFRLILIRSMVGVLEGDFGSVQASFPCSSSLSFPFLPSRSTICTYRVSWLGVQEVNWGKPRSRQGRLQVRPL
jgi:hypothetical protein